MSEYHTEERKGEPEVIGQERVLTDWRFVIDLTKRKTFKKKKKLKPI